MALPRATIDLWKQKTYLSIDGYRSTSLDERVARGFAAMNESDELNEVILKIKMENKSCKHYISLDRKDYSMYPDEIEILL